MVISELVNTVRDIIPNSDCPQLEAEYIVMAAMGAGRTEYVLKRSEAAGEAVEKAAFSMAERRRKGEPLAYIISAAEFMGLKFKVTPATLIPRSDTETLVEFAIDKAKDKKLRVLDIGTGSGCIGISVAHYCKDASVTMLDISEVAIKIAAENARANNVHAEFVECDILSDLPQGKFDMILSNPPYIRAEVIPVLQTEVRDFEPVSALDGGEDGLLFYRRITEISKVLLNKGGILAFEIGYDQREAVMEIMSEYENVCCIKDLGGNDRVVYGTKI